MDLWKTISDIMTTIIDYFRMFDFSKAGDFVKMIMENFNSATMKDTLDGLKLFIKDIFSLIKGA